MDKLLIQNARVYQNGQFVRADVLCGDALIAKIGENMSIRRIEKASGDVLASYVHGGGRIGVFERSNSLTPSSSSSCINWRDRVGCVRWSSAAARVMFSSRATARKYRRTRSSMPSASSLFSPVYHAFQASRKVRNVYFV